MRRAAAAAALLLGLAAGCREPAPESAVLVVVDTLRADHLGLYGYGRDTSPRLDAWAERAAVFEHAFSTSPWTLPAFGTLATGELPGRHRAGSFDRGPSGAEPAGAKSFRPLDPELPTLAERLGAAGFATGAVVNNAFLHPRFGLDRGFDRYDFKPGNRKKIRTADRSVDAALEWIDGREGPFFLLLHLFDPHLDYDAPAPFAGRFSAGVAAGEAPRLTDLEEIRERMRAGGAVDWSYLEALYDEEIAFVDAELGRFFDGLEARGLGATTLVLVTADHGEEFQDHGRFEHGHTVYNELVRVPLLVRGPGVEARRIEAPVSLADLFPTLLEALTGSAPDDVRGRSLLRLVRGGAPPEPAPLVAEGTLYGPEERALVRWPHKLVLEPRSGRRALFDLDADFAETRDLAPERTELAARLAGALERLAAAENGAPEVELDEETVRALRSLGYID